MLLFLCMLFFLSLARVPFSQCFKWNLVWYRFANEMGKGDGYREKNLEIQCSFFSAVRFECLFKCVKKTSSFSLYEINRKCVDLVLFFVSIFPKNYSALVNEYQYLYLCKTWQCETLDILCGIQKMHSFFFLHSFCVALIFFSLPSFFIPPFLFVLESNCGAGHELSWPNRIFLCVVLRLDQL